ncbi:MAG: bifunctional serine/threonine-protein kinase/formylglycine-generating enzyme family protein [Planctomycetota bacterium]
MTTPASLLDDPILANAPVSEGYKIVGPVALYAKLGQGGMGAVYKGKHARLNIDVVVKVMIPPAGQPPAQQDYYIKRFVREASIAASIHHHNLVNVSDVNSQNGLHYLIMEYVDGESVADRLERKGKLCEREALEIILGAAEGLAKAHSEGIVHRDIKPANILISKKGEVKVADLGLAKAIGTGDEDGVSMMTGSNATMGTPHYMSPEQIESARDVSFPADVWSLGVTLYQLLTNSLPWDDTTLRRLMNKICDDEPLDIKTLCPSISEDTCALIRKCLSKTLSDRYPNCGEMTRAVRKAIDALPDKKPGFSTTLLIDKDVILKQDETVMISPDSGAMQRISLTFNIEGSERNDSSRRYPIGAFVSPSPEILPAIISNENQIAFDNLMKQASIFESMGSVDGTHLSKALDKVFDALGLFPDSPVALKMKSALESRIAENLSAADRLMTYKTKMQVGEILSLKEQWSDAAIAYETAAANALDGESRSAAEAQAGVCRFQQHTVNGKQKEKKGDINGALDEYVAALTFKNDDEQGKQNIERINAALQIKREIDSAIEEYNRYWNEAVDLEKETNWAAAVRFYERCGSIAEQNQLTEKLLDNRDHRTRVLYCEKEKKTFDIEKYLKATMVRANEAIGSKDWDTAQKELRNILKYRPNSERVKQSLDAVERRIIKKNLKAITFDLGSGIKMEMILIPAGEFMMGLVDSDGDAKPIHKVIISKPFYMGKYPVKQVEYDKLMETNPSNFKGINNPVEMVSWDDAQEFCKRLSQTTGYTVTLPTEAQWEYACRAGTTTRWHFGDDESLLDEYAWYYSNSSGRTRPVGQKKPNAWGLYDMHGNVWEWTQDWYGSYTSETQADPMGPFTSSFRVARGGSWFGTAEMCQSAFRYGHKPVPRPYYLGFRIIAVPSNGIDPNEMSLNANEDTTKHAQAAIRDKDGYKSKRELKSVLNDRPGDADTPHMPVDVNKQSAPKPYDKLLVLDLGNDVKTKLVLIPAGEFMMGSDEYNDEKPIHKVIITKPFYMGKYEVTQEQYKKVIGTNPSHFRDTKNPVEWVSWNDAQEFCKKLSQKTGYTISLPTEAQWEYACRSGTMTKWHSGNNESQLGKYAWYRSNSGRKTHPVGQKKPNAWGLYDMHGNIWEWCSDWYVSYSSEPRTDPMGPTTGTDRVIRGGDWSDYAAFCRSANRGWNAPDLRYDDIGFRIVAVPKE